ncbi:WD40-repeat-containing domain protein [Sparassis latifolia]
MPLQYRLKSTFDYAHEDTINCVAISPDGSHLASGSTDKKIIVWSLTLQEPVHRIVAHSAVLSLVWSSNSARILCGTEDGTLLTISFDQATITASGFEGHPAPIESLAINSQTNAQLASAALSVVKVWFWKDTYSQWKLEGIVDDPGAILFTAEFRSEAPIRVTSLHWLSTSPSNNHLVVSYLHHGVVCLALNSGSFSVLWSLRLPFCISPDNKLLAVNDITHRFTLYKIPSGQKGLQFQVPLENIGLVLPIVFIHGGSGLVGGTSVGKVYEHCQEVRYSIVTGTRDRNLGHSHRQKDSGMVML